MKMDDEDPLGVRKDFPATREYRFLNTAYIGLTPEPVVQAARDWVEARALHTYSVGKMEAKKAECRRLVAELTGAYEDEISFLSSTTEGENVVVQSLDFRPGDNVVFDDLVYESTPVIYRRLEQTHGVEMRVVPNRGGAASVEDFARLVDQRTRIISVAWISNTSGYRHDIRGLADLAHAHHAYLYADAAQFIGVGPMDAHALGVDFFCSATYKWLHAGFGLAPFYVRRALLDRIQAPNVGWMVEKHLPGYQYQHYRTARKFEYSSPAYGQFWDLAAALAYLKQTGLDKIEKQCVGLARTLREGLDGRGFTLFTPANNASPIVSFLSRSTAAEAQALFDRERIRVSIQEAPAPLIRIRVSPAFFNNRFEIEAFLAASERLAR